MIPITVKRVKGKPPVSPNLNILMGSKTIRVAGVLFDYPVFSRIQIVLGYGVVGRFLARVEKNKKDRAQARGVINNLNRFFNK